MPGGHDMDRKKAAVQAAIERARAAPDELNEILAARRKAPRESHNKDTSLRDDASDYSYGALTVSVFSVRVFPLRSWRLGG